MFHDLAVSASRNSDLYGMIFVLLVILITSGRRWRGGGGPGGFGSGCGGGWREQMRDRMERAQEERRQFQTQVLDELRLQREATEKQNELLARLVGERTSSGA